MKIKEFNELLKDKRSLNLTLIISVFYVLPLLIANVYYSDDHSRILFGHGWNHDARFVNNWITKITSFSNFTFSLYPYSLILSALVLGFTGYVLCEIWGIEKERKFKWSSLLLLISPFYLANLPYRYDVFFMSLSIFFMVVPFVFFFNKKRFVTVSGICFFLTLGLFQPSVSIFFSLGIVYLYNYFEKNELKNLIISFLLMILSFAIGGLLYYLTKTVLNLGVNDYRMELILLQPGFKQVIIEKFLVFLEIWSLLYNNKFYYILLISFLLLPIISLIDLFFEKKTFFYIIKALIGRFLLILTALILILGPNLFIKAEYLPLRALPGLGAFMFSMVYFSRNIKGVFFRIFRILMMLNTIFCFNLMTQTSNALQFQKEYQEMFVYDLNSVVRTYHIKKMMFKGDISYARKSYKILEQFPFIKTIVLKEIGQNAWFSKDVISFSGLQETIEFIPYTELKKESELIFKSYVYNLYKIENGFFMIEFN
ncbi:glucosyltransferase domain-containing protein [Flavobacterium dauae]|uniref:glucosyltransferase domain-containing protein n=1 Tax=Flavobacterium dauae TaxID=1563479 RepID=UPI00101B4549|nr:glucosyltransferase domain-containing protein [Flavobacterium dauae]WLD23444.1 glucosyltransferase domain-containing protein [Flavobacterium dauae]